MDISKVGMMKEDKVKLNFLKTTIKVEFCGVDSIEYLDIFKL
jgi:hypothetical protein